jgi:hypothetical protein
MDPETSLRTATQKCLCCGYVTLHEPPNAEICPLCDWQDEGLAEHLVEEGVGGANLGFSVHEGRSNFKGHLKMYPRGYKHFDDSPAEIAAKQRIVAALEALKERPEREHEALWATIERGRGGAGRCDEREGQETRGRK